jgi:hypothetical protein
MYTTKPSNGQAESRWGPWRVNHSKPNQNLEEIETSAILFGLRLKADFYIPVVVQKKLVDAGLETEEVMMDEEQQELQAIQRDATETSLVGKFVVVCYSDNSSKQDK